MARATHLPSVRAAALDNLPEGATAKHVQHNKPARVTRGSRRARQAQRRTAVGASRLQASPRAQRRAAAAARAGSGRPPHCARAPAARRCQQHVVHCHDEVVRRVVLAVVAGVRAGFGEHLPRRLRGLSDAAGGQRFRQPAAQAHHLRGKESSVSRLGRRKHARKPPRALRRLRRVHRPRTVLSTRGRDARGAASGPAWLTEKAVVSAVSSLRPPAGARSSADAATAPAASTRSDASRIASCSAADSICDGTSFTETPQTPEPRKRARAAQHAAWAPAAARALANAAKRPSSRAKRR